MTTTPSPARSCTTASALPGPAPAPSPLARLQQLSGLAAPVGTPIDDPAPAALGRALAECGADRLVLGHRGRSGLQVRAATDDVAAAWLTLQARLGSGPVLDALADGQVISTPDLTTDPRWPRLHAAAATGPVHSVLSIPLAVAGHPDGVLTAYCTRVGAFDDDHAVTAAIEAAAGVALTLTASAWRSTADNLTVALASSRRIGAAIGVLMSQLHLTDEQAFDALRTLSQETHRKLREIADDVLLTGALPVGRRSGPGR